ncbi:MAG: hypothetical protein M3527_09495, partial [Actinomycetota bacterium]|nr:hypothetical protein [Actinomycetota bacterium]
MAEIGSSVRKRRRPAPAGRMRAFLALLLVATAVPLMAAGAAAQACDPAYGCFPPTTVTTPTPICTHNGDLVSGGESLVATVTNAPAGVTLQITVAGVVSGSGTTNASGQAGIPFTVPSGLGAGLHQVFAVGGGISVNCG